MKGVSFLPRHEYGIMENPPKHGERYDSYEPEKYNCISVDDVYLEEILEEFSHIDMYWHSLDVPGKGIAYCGINLIPPESMDAYIRVIGGRDGFGELTELLEKAKAENKFVIHYGL